MHGRIRDSLKASWHKLFGIFMIAFGVLVAASPVIFRLYPDDTLVAVLFSSVYGAVLALTGRDCMKDRIEATIGAGVLLLASSAFVLLVAWNPGSEGTWGAMARYSVAGVAVLLGGWVLVKGVHLRFEKEKEIRRWRQEGRSGGGPGAQKHDTQTSDVVPCAPQEPHPGDGDARQGR